MTLIITLNIYQYRLVNKSEFKSNTLRCKTIKSEIEKLLRYFLNQNTQINKKINLT